MCSIVDVRTSAGFAAAAATAATAAAVVIVLCHRSAIFYYSVYWFCTFCERHKNEAKRMWPGSVNITQFIHKHTTQKCTQFLTKLFTYLICYYLNILRSDGIKDNEINNNTQNVLVYFKNKCKNDNRCEKKQHLFFYYRFFFIFRFLLMSVLCINSVLFLLY